MNSDLKPEEFITLKSGERQNFAEIYDKKYKKFYSLNILIHES
jgi:hypothetical protein